MSRINNFSNAGVKWQALKQLNLFEVYQYLSRL
jgi:hypothetical protein